ncbi:hypothetical protein CLAIMM_02314 [Cladophialophora immunda]|nr:hypothetical protein CLAIMM_02314 [Cladophialophora immunda]
MESVYAILTDRARTLYRTRINQAVDRPSRILIALAGPPGSGKSTVATSVVKRLNADSLDRPYAAVLPMDGFHYTRATLDMMENSAEAHARRGVVWTFHAEGVLDLVKALNETRSELDQVHWAPSFDHALKDPVPNTIKIDSNIRLLVLEGNWLLYNEQPWATISELVDDTWFIDVDDDLALQRVAMRHLQCGIESTWVDAVHRATTNDLVNGQLVRNKLVAPAVRVMSVDEAVGERAIDEIQPDKLPGL